MTKTIAPTNKFTNAEYVAYRLQIWRDTFNLAFQATGSRSEQVSLATKAANEATAAFKAEFENDITK